MEKLSTIQKRENLNEVWRMGGRGPGDAFHDYAIVMDNAGKYPEEPEQNFKIMPILFQKGPRKDPDARHGVLDEDLLEIVRDRMTAFQAGPYACRENACALTHIEEALMWLNKRKEDRLELGVLGTMEK